jgi:hypothetical protein
MIISTRGYGWPGEGHMARVTTTNDDDNLWRENDSDIVMRGFGCRDFRRIGNSYTVSSDIVLCHTFCRASDRHMRAV